MSFSQIDWWCEVVPHTKGGSKRAFYQVMARVEHITSTLSQTRVQDIKQKQCNLI